MPTLGYGFGGTHQEKPDGTKLDIYSENVAAGLLGNDETWRYGAQGDAQVFKGKLGNDYPIGVEGGLGTASAEASVGNDGLSIEAQLNAAEGAVTLGNFTKDSNVDHQLRLGLSAGPGIAGRLHWGKQDGQRAYGFGFDAGPVSMDLKTEDPVGEVIDGTTLMRGGVALPPVYNRTEAAGEFLQRGATKTATRALKAAAPVADRVVGAVAPAARRAVGAGAQSLVNNVAKRVRRQLPGSSGVGGRINNVVRTVGERTRPNLPIPNLGNNVGGDVVRAVAERIPQINQPVRPNNPGILQGISQAAGQMMNSLPGAQYVRNLAGLATGAARLWNPIRTE